MNRFNEKIGAGVLVGLAVLYMILSLATGRNASGETPPDLSAPKAGVNVWQASNLLIKQQGKVVIVDVRDSKLFGLYHIKGSISVPKAGVKQVLRQVSGKSAVLLVGDKDKDMALLAGKVAHANKGIKVHFLKDGVRGWYLTYELPIQIFSTKKRPFGWEDAMNTARAWFKSGGQGQDPAKALAAIAKLANLNYSPTLLQGKKKKAGGGKKKKISGGCSG